jgi:hypothetical protein
MAFEIGQIPESEAPVSAGIDTFIMQDNRILGYSTEMSIAEDNSLQGFETLGYYGQRGFKSLSYVANITLGTFLLLGEDISGALSIPGWRPDGTNNINNSGYYTFTGLDIHTLSALFTIIGCKPAGRDLNIAVGALNTLSTRWMGRAMLPGLQTS